MSIDLDCDSCREIEWHLGQPDTPETLDVLDRNRHVFPSAAGARIWLETRSVAPWTILDQEGCLRHLLQNPPGGMFFWGRTLEEAVFKAMTWEESR